MMHQIHLNSEWLLHTLVGQTVSNQPEVDAIKFMICSQIWIICKKKKKTFQLSEIWNVFEYETVV